MTVSERKFYVRSVMIQEKPPWPFDLPTTFSDVEYKGMAPLQDDPIVVWVVTGKYKVERVLVDQGSSTNKLGIPELELEECPDTLTNFSGE
ncbi:hypothetical protein CR513_25107, partial [Mucuna pruriens]